MRWKLSGSSYLCSHSVGFLILFSAVFVLLAGGYLPAAEETSEPKVTRYRVFSLKHISSDKGKEYLAQLKIGTVSKLPGANVLLVTASPRELIEASAILKLVDAEEEFAIKQIPAALLAQDLLSNERIAAKVADISIGNFSEPPAGPAQRRAIIDVHDNAVIIIAPAKHLEKIVSAIGPLKEPKADIPQPDKVGEAAEPNQTSEITSEVLPEEIILPPDLASLSNANRTKENELFSKLLESLAEAERMVAEPNEQVSRPNEPNFVAFVAKPNEPNFAIIVPRPNEPNIVVVLPEPNVPTEAPVEQPEEATLAAVLERLKAIEAKLQPGPAPELITVEVGQPNEVTRPVPEVRYGPEPIPDGEKVLSLNLPQTLPMEDFLGFMGENLHLDYLYDPKKVTGTINLRLHGKLRGDIKRKDLYPLLESVLQFNGFVMTRKGNLVIIVPKAEADNIDATIVREADDKLKYGDVIVTRVFELKHVDTATAQNLLTGMQLGVKITEISEMGTLVVTGYAYRMARIEELLEMIDQPGAPKQFRFRPLRYTMAKTLAPKIKTLVEQLEEEISITVSAEAAAPQPVKQRPGESSAAYRARLARERRKQPVGRPPTKRAEPAAKAPSVYLDFDERTNRVLMIGFENELNIVEELIDSLDVEQQDLRTLHLYEIQNVDAEEVRNKLSELGIISAAKTTQRSTTTQRPGAPKPGTKPTPSAATSGTAEEALVEEPQIVIIEATNSLLVNATAEQHARIALIIAYVDTITLDITIPYVVYPLENQDPVELAAVLNQLVSETVTSKDAKGAKIEKTTKRTEDAPTIIPDPKTYSLIVYASKKDQQWISSIIQQLDQYRPQVLLDVMLVEITKNDEFNFDLNIISSLPDLVNTSGLTGTIIGGDSPILSSDILGKLTSKGMDRFIDLQSDKGSGTAFYGNFHINMLMTAMQKKNYGRILARPKLLVNDNEEGTIKADETIHITRERITYRKGTATGGVGVEDIPITDVEFLPYEAGIQLDIKPHISKGDQLQLTIKMTRKDFRLTGDTSALAKPPDIVTSDVTTVVTVPDSKTIILGGMERLSQSKGGTKLPLLGDLPIVGGLFRGTANTDKQNRLYVFVKAHILRPGEEMTGESDIELVSAKNRADFERYEREMQEYEDWPGIKPQPLDPLRILEND